MTAFLRKLNPRLDELGARATPYDIGAVRQIYRLDKDLRYTYKPQFGPRKYSDALISWIVEKIRRDKLFFVKTRSKLRGEKRRGPRDA
jgi:hypothetical protein